MGNGTTLQICADCTGWRLSYVTWDVKEGEVTRRQTDTVKADSWAAPYLCWYSRPQGQVHIGNIADLIHKWLAILNASTQENEHSFKTEYILSQITFLTK